MIKIKGFILNSFVEITGFCSSVLFFEGCNFRCGFCQNPELVEPKKYNLQDEYSLEEILNLIEKRKDWIDLVVITGGEPTIHKELKDILSEIRDKGFKTAIETNGSNPDILQELIEENLLDYIAMDIKGELEKYEEIVRVKINIEKLKESIELVKSFNSYEFRITMVPIYINLENFLKILEPIVGCKLLVLQQFNNEKTLDPTFQKIKPYTYQELMKFKQLAKKYVKKVLLKNI